MGRRSPSTSPSHRRKRSRKNYAVEKPWPAKARLGRKAGTKVEVGKQELWIRRQAETVKSPKEHWTKEGQKKLRWKDVTRDLHEAGLHINERKASWPNKDLLTQAE